MRRSFGDDLFLRDNSNNEILLAVQDMFKFISLPDYETRLKKYESIIENYLTYLKKNSLNHLEPHMPLSPSFLEMVDND